jgi:hypothetical protein
MRRPPSAWRTALCGVVALLLVACGWQWALPVWADTAADPLTFRCDGQLLSATLHSGAVDDPSIPNSSAGTLPGAFVVLQSPELSLQLPRTNNAGPPSFTDGQWWWSLEDPDHPTLLHRRGLGEIQRLACNREPEFLGG